MSNKNNLTSIWDVYQNSLQKDSSIVEERAGTGPVGTQGPLKTQNRKARNTPLKGMQGGTKSFGTKPGKGAVYTNSKAAKDIANAKSTEIDEVDGFEPALDPKTMSKKVKDGNLYNVSANSSQQFDEKIRKSYLEGINNNMKSVFDKLFEEVMGSEDASEIEALGIDVDVEETGEMEDSDDVTITLDRDMAEKLCDILSAACGHDEDTDETEDVDVDVDVDEDEETYDEAYVEADPTAVNMSGAHALTKNSAGSNKVKSTNTGKADNKKATSKIKNGIDGSGTDVPDSAGHSLAKQGKGSNKVKGQTVTGKVGGDAFSN